MIENSFLHIPGIGLKTEQRLWQSGTRCWDDFTPDCPVRFSESKIDAINASLEESRKRIKSGDPRCFSDKLPADQHWRFFPVFRASTAYLDIETTGLEKWSCDVTTIALYDGKRVRHYVNGENLDDFVADISDYSVIVTYNGKTFDVPFIESYFGTKLDQAHIDLRYILASLGYAGGLKRCEIQLGLDRGDLADVDGFFAVLLWYDYVGNGNQKALETLLAYNIQDTINLETLMVMAYNMKIKDTPFHQNQLSKPVMPLVPFAADMKTVDRIRRAHSF